jgi:hypothetical protein
MAAQTNGGDALDLVFTTISPLALVGGYRNVGDSAYLTAEFGADVVTMEM